jgi:hypothetical protein
MLYKRNPSIRAFSHQTWDILFAMFTRHDADNHRSKVELT